MNRTHAGELGHRNRAAAARYPRVGRERKPLGWPVLGVVVGLLIWVIAIPLLGDPRISHRVTPASVQGAPVLVARSSFALLSEADPQQPGVPSGSGMLQETTSQVDAFKPVRRAITVPGVAEALGLEDHHIAALTPPGPVDAATAPAEAPAAVSPFGDPDTLPPGGKPVASMAMVVNPTEQPLQGTLKPTVMLGDAGLCRALKMAAVAVEADADPVVLMAGTLSQTLSDPAEPLILEPAKAYNLAILLTLPSNVPNEFQGASCTVNFLMEFAEVL